MTYNVFGGTLNIAQLTTQLIIDINVAAWLIN